MPKEIDFIRYALPPSSQNYKSVEKLFSKTMDPSTFTILSIERIQNPFMWSMYQRQKEYMKTKVSAPDLEWRLFHGTDKDSIAKICKNNFDFRVCGKRGSPTRFGEGSYFACNAGFSDYYSEIDSAGWKYMFLADVLVGRYAEGKSSYKRPPEINHETGELYHSCVNRLSDPTTFVVFDRNQLYPSFLIIYTKKRYTSASGSRSCSETKATELMHRREHSFRETKAMSSAQSKQHKVQCTWIEDTPSNSGQHSGGTSFSATSPSSSSPHNEQSSVVISTFDSRQFNVNVPVPTSIAAIQFNKPNDLQSTVITSLPNISSHIEQTRQAISEAYGAQQGVSTATVTSSPGFTSSNMLNRGTATAKWSPSLTSSISLSVSTTTATSSNSLISSNMLSVSTATATSLHSLTSGNELSLSTATATSSPSLITSNMLIVSTATATLSPSLISSNMLIMSTETAMSSPSLISSNMLSVGTAMATSSPSLISSNTLSVSTATATSSPSLISSNMLSVSTATATSSPSLISSNMLSVSTAKATSSPSLISSNMLSVSTAKATSSPSLISSNMLSVSTAKATSSPSLISSNMLSVSTAKATSSPSLISSNMLSVSTATAMSSPSLTSSNMLSVSTATAMSSPCPTSSDMQPNLSFSSSKKAPKPHSSMTKTPSCNKTSLSPSSRKQHYVQSSAALSPSYRTPSFLMMSSKSHFCPDAPDIVDLIAYFRQPANSLPRCEHPSGLKTDTRQQTKCSVM
ncbi:uncharacterized protein [Ptychodera flava]|uniref:uncharacterized protein isoform X1 n=1 Tax=Ptychodera flava TaxID=63121 RepID=UPI003969EF2A